MKHYRQFLFSVIFASAFLIFSHAHAAENSQVLESFDHNIQVTTLADGLTRPWAMAILPDGDILVTEQPGRLRLIRDGRLQYLPIAGTPEITGRLHSGLMDITLHPDFAENQMVYMSHSKITDQGSTLAVSRAKLEDTRLTGLEEIFVAFAWDARELNYGSRITFDDAGYMFVSIGDRGPDGEPKAQDLGFHNGKIVRLHDDGSIPTDNPFVNVSGALPEIYSYGHRNPQGMTWNPVTQELWASEHGPRGGDEVNIILPGANYGWPVVSFGRTYPGEVITDDPMMAGMEPPRWFWVPSIGISEIIYYDGAAFPAWQNKLMVTGMSGMMLQTVVLEGRASRERESLLASLRLQYRDVDFDAAGNIYLVVRHDANATENTGQVLMLTPAD